MKKNSIWRSASPKCCVIEGRRGRRTWRTVRRPGVKQQNVFSQPRFGDNKTDFHVACTSKPVLYFGIRETLTALAVRRVQKNDLLRRSRFVSCVRAQVHMTPWLFVLICLHVACTNKNLGNERVTTLRTYQLLRGLFGGTPRSGRRRPSAQSNFFF